MEALNRLAQATAIVVRWIPDSAERSLREWTEAAFEGSSDPATAAEPDGSLFSIVRQAVPSSLTRPTAPVDLPRRLDATSDAMRRHSRAVNRWLAGRLFGTWIAYQGGGLLTIVRYLRAALDVLTVELARAAAKGDLTGPPCWKACVGATISSSTWPSRNASPVFCPETLCLFSIGFFATSPSTPAPTSARKPAHHAWTVVLLDLLARELRDARADGRRAGRERIPLGNDRGHDQARPLRPSGFSRTSTRRPR